MPCRLETLTNNEYYHVYNCGVEKRKIFNESNDFNHFLECIFFYQNTNPLTKFSQRHFTRRECKIENKIKYLGEIIVYCLMSNHFHLIIKQLKENGISTIMRKFSNSYSKYFNAKYSRIGPLFQGSFKVKRIMTNEQLLHLSRYIHLNPYVSKVVEDPLDYIWSSLKDYLSRSKHSLINKTIITSQFSTPTDYKKFVLDYSDYALSLEQIKHEIIE